MKNRKVLLGYTKPERYGKRSPIYLYDFSWDCGWYWGGGYIGNKNLHCHFNGAFLEMPDPRGHSLGDFVTPWDTSVKQDLYVHNPGRGPVGLVKNRLEDSPQYKARVLNNGSAVWEPITKFLDDVPPHVEKSWWRVKDLFKQFYVLQAELLDRQRLEIRKWYRPQTLINNRCDALEGVLNMLDHWSDNFFDPASDSLKFSRPTGD